MTSPLFALFARSLREDTRGKVTYFARGGLAAFTLLVTAGTTIGSRGQGAPGLTFFSIVVTLQVLCVTIAGLGYFASAVTEEKEEMTLGLLRMTNLNPLSILLGKSTSRLCSALLLLAVQLPFALLAVTLGGISAQQIMASLLAIGAFTFMLCNLALLASVIAQRTAGAAALTAVGLGIYFGGGWYFGVSLGARLIEVLSTGFAGSVVGWQVISNLALGVLCFLAAWAAFGRFCDRALEGAAAAGTARRQVLGLRFRRPPRPWKNAIAWKEFHFACGGRPAFIVRCCGYGLAVAVVLLSVAAPGLGWMWFGNVGVVFVPSIVSFAFTVEVAVMAARLIGSERREQTLSTLASLPLEMRHLVRGKIRGCLLAAAPGLVVASFAGLAHYSVAGTGQAFLLPTLLVHIVTNWCYLLFLVCLIAFLSLFLLRGALPLGFIISVAISTILQMFLFAIVFAGGMAGGFVGGGAVLTMQIVPVVTAILYLVAGVIFYRRSFARLEIIAGES